MSKVGSAVKMGAKGYGSSVKFGLRHPIKQTMHPSTWGGPSLVRGAKQGYTHPNDQHFHSTKNMSGAHHF